MSHESDAFNRHPVNEQFGPWVDSWVTKIAMCREAKKDFDKTADEIRMFFNHAEKFWDDTYKKSWDPDGIINTRFRMRMSKAFEMVALFGPMLFWSQPQTKISPRPGVDVLQDLVPDPQQFEQVAQMQAAERRVGQLRAKLQERVCNWLPGEQNGGGLKAHGRRAIVEALLTGRGCLWSQMYYMPESDTKLCGAFFDTVDNLLIDADCMTPDLSDAQFIVQEVCQPAWVIERTYGLPRGTLKAFGTAESSSAISETPAHRRKQDRRDGKTHNLVKHYRIYSKCGVGARFKEQDAQARWNQKILDQLEQTCGDFVFLVIVPGLKYPLNLPGARLGGDGTPQNPGMTPDQVKEALRWPIEHWRDGSWPVSLLDFYEDPRSPWPVAPLKASVGWLNFMSIMVSIICDRGFANAQDILGVNGAAYDTVMKAMAEKTFPKVIQLDGITKSVAEAMQFVQPPPVQPDVQTALEYAMTMFEKSSGMNDLVYGQTTTQDRSAATTQVKQQQTQIRPDDMASKVEEWMTDVAVNMRLMAHTYLTGQDVYPLLGQFGAQAWDQLVATLPMEHVLRGFDVTVEANSVRKPNKATELENVQQGMQTLMPLFQAYAQATGNMDQVNELIKRFCSAMDWEETGLAFPPPPQPDPNQPDPAQQAQQQQMQAQQQADQAKLQAVQVKAQVDQQKAQMEMQQMQAEFQMRMQEMQAEMAVKQQELELEKQKLSMQAGANQQNSQYEQQAMLMRLQEMQAKSQQSQQDRELKAQMEPLE